MISNITLPDPGTPLVVSYGMLSLQPQLMRDAASSLVDRLNTLATLPPVCVQLQQRAQ